MPSKVVETEAIPATVPVRFCEPLLEAQSSGIPAALWRASSTLEPRLSI